MSAVILGFCDSLEAKIREFLAANPDGGKFVLPEVTRANSLSIPVMVGVFEQENYDIEYDCDVDTDEEWLVFRKQEPKALTSGYDDDAYDGDAYTQFSRFSD